MSSTYYDNIVSVGNSAQQEFSQRHDAREQALRIGREVIRLSANAIRAVHRYEFDEAKTRTPQFGTFGRAKTRTP